MNSALAHIKNLFTGLIVGVASMLPGVSGATIAVCFGIYERLIADLADVVHKLRADLIFILLLGVGIIVGMGGTAVGLKYLMNGYIVIALFFFIGLIIGQVPELYKLTEPSIGKPSKWNIVALIIAFAITLCLIFLGTSNDVSMEHDAFSYFVLFVVGVIFAVSKMAPGISGSTVLLALGLYQPMLTAMTCLDWALLIPLCVGLIIGLIGFAKVMNWAINEHRRSSYFAILGLTVGSILVISSYVYSDVSSYVDIVAGIISMVLGIVLSLLFIHVGNGIKNLEDPIR